MTIPRILVSGMSGGSGKTTISLGLARYFAQKPELLVPKMAHNNACKEPCGQHALSQATLSPARPYLPGESPALHTAPGNTPFQEKLADFNHSVCFCDSIMAVSRAHRPVQTFKKGPDYIDAAWLGLAGQCMTRTLDPYFSPPSVIQSLFSNGTQNAACALIEGNRGLYDGVDVEGSCSSAQLAKTLSTPVLLVVDCTKMTRTVAALVLGCIEFDKDLTIGGIILNRLGTERQEGIIRAAISHYTDVPVMGALPRLRKPLLPERSLGLCAITGESSAQIEAVTGFVTQHIDVEAIWQLMSDQRKVLPDSSIQPQPDCTLPATQILPEVCAACDTGPAAPGKIPTASCKGMDQRTSEQQNGLPYAAQQPLVSLEQSPGGTATTALSADETSGSPGHPVDSNTFPDGLPSRPTIGYIHDEAIWFYYTENLEALEQAGASLCPLSLFSETNWDKVNGIYIGGGQIEPYAQKISQSPQLGELKFQASQGMPVFAEGAGLVLTATAFIAQDTSYPMAGIFDITVSLATRPQGLGYTQARVDCSIPFFGNNQSLPGHEFHFFSCVPNTPQSTCLELVKGRGLYTGTSSGEASLPRDGLMHRNTFASLMHIFAPSVYGWAENFVVLATMHSKSAV